jgi:hypothetical protein
MVLANGYVNNAGTDIWKNLGNGFPVANATISYNFGSVQNANRIDWSAKIADLKRTTDLGIYANPPVLGRQASTLSPMECIQLIADNAAARMIHKCVDVNLNGRQQLDNHGGIQPANVARIVNLIRNYYALPVGAGNDPARTDAKNAFNTVTPNIVVANENIDRIAAVHWYIFYAAGIEANGVPVGGPQPPVGIFALVPFSGSEIFASCTNVVAQPGTVAGSASPIPLDGLRDVPPQVPIAIKKANDIAEFWVEAFIPR